MRSLISFLASEGLYNQDCVDLRVMTNKHLVQRYCTL